MHTFVSCPLLRVVRKCRYLVIMTSRRVSYEQLETLWDFLNNHKDIAMGYNKSAQAREMSRRLWIEVTENLNSIVGGAIKDFKGWAAYWIDYKGKLKRKCATVKSAQSRTGGGPAETMVLTDIEKKYLSILGEDYGSGLPDIQVDPLDVEITLAPPISNDSALSQTSQSILVTAGTSEAVEENIHVYPALQVFSVPGIEAQVSTIPPPIQPEPMSSTPPQRRQRRSAPMSQDTARRALVESSRMRAEATREGSTSLIGILNELSRISTILENINNRLAGLPTNDR